MAIAFINQTECGICNEKIIDLDIFFSFPPFIQNIKDPLYQFNDSVFHINCLNKHSFGKKAIELAKQYFYSVKPENRKCIVDGEIIENFHDYIFMGILASNDDDELYKFNFITLNSRNLYKWKDRTDFINIAEKFIENGKWEDLTSYKYLNKLIDSIKQDILT
ncbi:hypothetical protein [Chryseobacterium rhizosphaerae]|uniref:hypothetical protein n=1 Tax=Chryseobacterium rhizosphaerae TaxID=395937 RepID=UPI00235A1410|nr:hypothetical protein [Chryseobacterium rhizosphaerae]MDC8098674.1 hypothetical protein [Chryseobacterium rhizosphaerae]